MSLTHYYCSCQTFAEQSGLMSEIDPVHDVYPCQIHCCYSLLQYWYAARTLLVSTCNSQTVCLRLPLKSSGLMFGLYLNSVHVILSLSITLNIYMYHQIFENIMPYISKSLMVSFIFWFPIKPLLCFSRKPLVEVHYTPVGSSIRLSGIFPFHLQFWCTIKHLWQLLYCEGSWLLWAAT